MGFKDKGLILLRNKPLISHVIDRVRPQVDELVISCNRNTEHYEQFGFPIVTDETSDYQGPLMGVLSAGKKISASYSFIVPCDMPYIPLDVVATMADAIGNHEVATATVNKSLEPLITLVKTDLIGSIDTYIESGARSVRGWLDTLNGTTVSMDRYPDAFKNINSAQELS